MNKSKDDDLILDHDYDGIRELNNQLPPWWLYLFYITIIWAILYMLYYHVLDLGDSSSVSYQKEINPNITQVPSKATFSLEYHSPFYSPQTDLTPLKKMELQQQQLRESAAIQSIKKREEPVTGGSSFDNLILAAMAKASPENLDKLKNAFPDLYAAFQQRASVPTAVEAQGSSSGTIAEAPQAEIQPLTDAASLAAGKQVFLTNCITCHGKAGEGGIGPNLTDDYYLHGRGMTNTVKTITNGVPVKGMISWRGILKEEQIRQVASYILTLYGTNPPNPKAPQGEKIESTVGK